MAKYGLGQIDLNLLAQMSLAGLTNEPARHLSNLLRSGQPIEMKTRQALADLIDGRTTKVQVRISSTQKNKVVRTFRKVLRDLAIGREVNALKDQMTYHEATSEVAQTNKLGEKTVERCYTLSREFERWLEACRLSGNDHSDLAIEAAFAYSKAARIKPSEPIKPSIEQFGQLVERFESILVDAEGIPLPSGRPRISSG